MKITKNTEFDDLQEIRREIATQEVAERYDKNVHIQQVKDRLINDLNNRVPVKLTQEIIDLGLLDWFQITCIQYEGLRLLERMSEREYGDETLNLGLESFMFGN